jgi:hypothetical protein
LQVTLAGNVYLPEYPLGREGLPVVLSWTLSNEGPVPARLLSPVERGGWVWITPQGVELDFYGHGVKAPEWWGMTPAMHVTVLQGTSGVSRVNEVVVPEPGGQVAYLDQMGFKVAVWDVPPENSGSGYEAVLGVVPAA